MTPPQKNVYLWLCRASLLTDSELLLGRPAHSHFEWTCTLRSGVKHQKADWGKTRSHKAQIDLITWAYTQYGPIWFGPGGRRTVTELPSLLGMRGLSLDSRLFWARGGRGCVQVCYSPPSLLIFSPTPYTLCVRQFPPFWFLLWPSFKNNI